jgi:hypothetical protein
LSCLLGSCNTRLINKGGSAVLVGAGSSSMLNWKSSKKSSILST